MVRIVGSDSVDSADVLEALNAAARANHVMILCKLSEGLHRGKKGRISPALVFLLGNASRCVSRLPVLRGTNVKARIECSLFTWSKGTLSDC